MIAKRLYNFQFNFNLFNFVTNYCETPVQSPSFSFRLGVDFVSPLSQQQEQQEQQEEPHQNIEEGSILELLKDLGL